MSSKFYEEDIDIKNLRFGDILQGFIETVPYIENPLNDSFLKNYEYRIESYIPEFSVIMTPCCNIGEGTLSLVPLRKVTYNIYRNLSNEVIKDFVLLNREIGPKKLISQYIWENYLSDEEKAEKKTEGKAWAWLDRFFYGGNDFSEQYEVKIREEFYSIRDYVIDFKEIYQIKCNKIVYNNVDQEILTSKCLELSINARYDLRNKLSYYYGRIPEEDIF